jgi:hypothetical protein
MVKQKIKLLEGFEEFCAPTFLEGAREGSSKMWVLESGAPAHLIWHGSDEAKKPV